MQLPYLTAALPGAGGQIKKLLEDFVVEEIPLYTPQGVGTHCYITIEKRGISTMQAVRTLAQAVGRPSGDIGYAGLKDTQAVARQTFSVEHLETARARGLEMPHMRVADISRHRNKLKIGHLAGNRFTIKIRNDQWSKDQSLQGRALENAKAVLAALAPTGVPNFFGPQRFGMRKDNHLLGLAILQNNAQEFVRRFLGDPDPSVDHGDVLVARQQFANERLDLALQHWPGHLREERRALAAMVRAKGNASPALFAVDLPLKRLLVSAFQAFLFNEVLATRLPQLTRILPGDLCWKHDNGSVFAVEESAEAAQKEQPRCDAHEISPSGPMFGYRMTEPTGAPREMEAAALQRQGLTPEVFATPRAQKSKGGRRAMRFFPQDLDVAAESDAHGPFLQLHFALPPGCFATVLLGEIMKTDVPTDAAA